MFKNNFTIGFLNLFLAMSLHAQDLTLKIGDKPPKLDFTALTDSSNKNNMTWERLKGQVVIIDFWATWCTPCIKAFPHLNKLVKEFKNQPITFLSITYEPEHMLRPFLKKYKLDTIIGIDNDFAMFKSYKAWAIPMVVVVNKKGRIASVIHSNYLTNELIHEVLADKIPNVQQAQGWPDPEGAEEHFRSLLKVKK